MKAEIKVMCCGWNHSLWAESFFPEDIPADWRLDFYSNEFSELYLSSAEQIDDDFYCAMEESLCEEFLIFLPQATLSENQFLREWNKKEENRDNIFLQAISHIREVSDYENLAQAKLADSPIAPAVVKNQCLYIYHCDEPLSPKALRHLAEFLLQQVKIQFPDKSESIIYLAFSDSSHTVVNCQNLQLLSHML